MGNAHDRSWYHARLPGAAFKPLGRLRGLLVPMLVWLALACSASPPRTPVGISDAAPEPETQRATSLPAPRWSDFAAARSWPEAGPPVRALVHRRDGSLIHVRIDPAIPEALTAYRALAAESAMPEGTRVIAWHENPSGESLGAYLLQKRKGAWSPLQIDREGIVIPIEGDREGAACMRCHDMAPADHLFGAPKPAGASHAESIDPASR